MVLKIADIKVDNFPAPPEIEGLKVSQFCSEIRVNLPSGYSHKLSEIERELSLSTRECLMALIDLYYVEDNICLEKMRRQILKRIKKGVNKSFLIQLRLLYTALGHFLKKIRYI